MERVIYCPSIDLMEEATSLCKETLLPLQIGDSNHTKDLIFDRDKIQVVEVPGVEDFFSFGQVKQYFHQCIIYVNEFFVLKNKIILKINDEIIKASFEEKHRVKYSYLCTKIGLNVGKLYYENKVIKEFDFVVTEKV